MASEEPTLRIVSIEEAEPTVEKTELKKIKSSSKAKGRDPYFGDFPDYYKDFSENKKGLGKARQLINLGVGGHEQTNGQQISPLDEYKLPTLDNDDNENYAKLISLVEKELNRGKKEGARSIDGNSNYAKYKRIYIQNLFVEAAEDVYEKYNLQIPGDIINEINYLHKSRKNIINFIKKAQEFSGQKKTGIFICELIREARTQLEIDDNIESFEKLKENTIKMADEIAQQINPNYKGVDLEKITGTYDPDDDTENKKRKALAKEEQTLTRKKKTERNDKTTENQIEPIRVKFGNEKAGGYYEIQAAFFSTKSQRSFKRKVRGKTKRVIDIFNDGVRGLFLVDLKHFPDAIKHLESLGFSLRGNRFSPSAQARPEVLLRKTLEDGTNAEMRIAQWGKYGHSESGVQTHKIYSIIFDALGFARGKPISRNRFYWFVEKAYQEALKWGQTVEKENVEKYFKEYFFEQNGKFWSWDSSRYAASKISPPEELNEMIAGLVNGIINAGKKDVKINKKLANFTIFEHIFNYLTFPANLTAEDRNQIITYLRSKRSFDKTIIEALEAHQNVLSMAAVNIEEQGELEVLNVENVERVIENGSFPINWNNLQKEIFFEVYIDHNKDKISKVLYKSLKNQLPAKSK